MSDIALSGRDDYFSQTPVPSREESMGLLTGLRSSISRAVSSMFSDSEPKRIGIYGPPNAGKCLAPDEMVLLADGTHSQIEEIFESVAATHPRDVSETAGERWLSCKNLDQPIEVLALGEDLSVEPTPVSHVFRQEYSGSLYRVRTRRGREVTASPEHPFITALADGVGTIPTAEITPGTPVAALPSSGSNASGSGGELLSDGGTVVTDNLSSSVDYSSVSVDHSNVSVDHSNVSVVGSESSTTTELNPGADIVWDEVVAVEELKHEGYIYDLTVPDRHTFTTSDGLVVHNTTLANRIVRDWTEHGDAVGPESHVPHETRRARRKENVKIERDGGTVTIDVVDTPGVTTKVDYTEFLDHDMDKDDAVRRSREATEGVAEAMHWLREDVDGVIYVLDSAQDPFTQVNTMLIGIIESQDLPVLILANKIDLEDSNIKRIRNAFPQHETIPLSALEGDNMDEVYDKIAEYFR